MAVPEWEDVPIDLQSEMSVGIKNQLYTFVALTLIIAVKLQQLVELSRLQLTELSSVFIYYFIIIIMTLQHSIR